MSRASVTSNSKRKSESRRGSPTERLSKTVSALSLMKSSSSSFASLSSLRNGKVTTFNERINDTFPKTIVRGSMPIISLPAINIEKKQQSMNLITRDERRLNFFSRDKRLLPASDLESANALERSKLMQYLGVTESYIGELIRLEIKRDSEDGDMITIFEKASKRLRPRAKTGDGGGDGQDVDDQSSSADASVDMDFDTFIGVDVRLATRGNNYSSASTRSTVNSRIGSQFHSLFSLSIYLILRQNFILNIGTKARFSSLPAIDVKHGVSTASTISLLGSSSSALSPTWAMRSFVHLTGDTKMEAKGFDWDTLSIDESDADTTSVGSISTKKTNKTLTRKGSEGSRLKYKKKTG